MKKNLKPKKKAELGANWSLSNLSITLDNNYQWDVQVRAVDTFSNTATDLSLSIGMPNFFIGVDVRVSIGMRPSKTLASGDRGHLEVDGPVYSKVEATVGEEKHTLTVAEMPSHTHTQNSHSHTTYNRWNSYGGGNLSGYGYTSPANSWAQDGYQQDYTGGTTATNQNTGGNDSQRKTPRLV